MRLKTVFIFMVFACTQTQGQPTLEQQTTQSQLQQLQHEIEISRIEAETNQIRAQTQIMRLQSEKMNAEGYEGPYAKMLREIRDAQAQKASEDAAARAREEQADALDRASARSANSIFLCVAIALLLSFGFIVARRAKQNEGIMKEEEKFGILVMISAILLSFFSFVISEGWNPRFDALQNLMMTLKIRVLPESNSPYSDALFDIHTKYALLSLMAVATYGFTTYIGITPALRVRSIPSASSVESSKET